MSWVPTPSASLSGQTAEEVKALSAGLAEAALGRPAEIAVATFAEWIKAQ